MTDPAQWLSDLALDCEQKALSSGKFGRRYHYCGYTLMILSLAGSIGAAVLAFWDGVDHKLIGLVALLPAICASIAGQLRMIEKGSWHYRRKHTMQRIARQFRLSGAQNPDWAAAEAASRTHAEAIAQMDAEWESALVFRFQPNAAGAGVKEA